MEGKKKERKQGKQKAHRSTKQNLIKEKKVIAAMVWNLTPPNISCSAPFSIYRIATTGRYRFQFCGLSLYQEIGKKAIEDQEKESTKQKTIEQNYIGKILKSVYQVIRETVFM